MYGVQPLSSCPLWALMAYCNAYSKLSFMLDSCLLFAFGFRFVLCVERADPDNQFLFVHEHRVPALDVLVFSGNHISALSRNPRKIGSRGLSLTPIGKYLYFKILPTSLVRCFQYFVRSSSFRPDATPNSTSLN